MGALYGLPNISSSFHFKITFNKTRYSNSILINRAGFFFISGKTGYFKSPLYQKRRSVMSDFSQTQNCYFHL